MQICKINTRTQAYSRNICRTQLTSQIPGILRIIAARTFTLFNGIVILWSFHRFVWCARGTGRVCAKWFAAIEEILWNAISDYDNCQSPSDYRWPNSRSSCSHPSHTHLVQRYANIFGWRKGRRQWEIRQHRRLAQWRPFAGKVATRRTGRCCSGSCSIRCQHAMVERLQQMRMKVVQELGAIVAD